MSGLIIGLILGAIGGFILTAMISLSADSDLVEEIEAIARDNLKLAEKYHNEVIDRERILESAREYIEDHTHRLVDILDIFEARDLYYILEGGKYDRNHNNSDNLRNANNNSDNK